MHHIVIVGGGVGGLELATRLGRTVGKTGKAKVTLIDKTLTHLWKPLLHEVAAGTLDSNREEMDYLTLAQRNGFQFRPGEMMGLDRSRKSIRLAGLTDADGNKVLPACDVSYDSLVIAIGSEGNDYGISGAREHCIFLDSREQADRFHTLLLNLFVRFLYQAEQDAPPLPTLQVAIVGAGATGVELAAELHNVSMKTRGIGAEHRKEEKSMQISLVEGGPRILPALPEKLAKAAERQLRAIDVDIITSARVQSITKERINFADGQSIPAHLKVWAAGIKAPDFFRELDGLETNRLNQLAVNQNLTTTMDENIYAIGDCAHCPQPNSDHPVPPRAQAAHQQAATLTQSLLLKLDGRAPLDYRYKDYGSLVSLSQSSVGNLMGNLTGNLFIEGWLARMIYTSLYRSHHWVLHGPLRTFLLILADLFNQRVKPRFKLH